jgi:putative membrane protein
MSKILIKLAVNIISVVIVAYLVAGINIANWKAAIITAAVIGILNLLLRPMLILLTLPLNILSLGLFTFVINGFIFFRTSKIVAGFTITGFWRAVLGALVFTGISSLLNFIIGPHNGIHIVSYGYDNRRKKKYEDIIDAEVTEERTEDASSKMEDQSGK